MSGRPYQKKGQFFHFVEVVYGGLIKFKQIMFFKKLIISNLF